MPVTAHSARIGEPLRRKEDLRLITGAGCFSDDVNLPQQVFAIMLRSPHAHARIVSIDVRAALASPGVLAVLTGRDWLADGLKPLPHQPYSFHPAEIPLTNKDGSPIFTPVARASTLSITRSSGSASG